MMEYSYLKPLAVCTLLGSAAAVLHTWSASALQASLPVGTWLRQLSLSGFLGNLLVWGVVLTLSLSPILLRHRLRRGTPWGGIDWLLPLPCVLIGLSLFFLVNPTWLHLPIPSMLPPLLWVTALSGWAGWWILYLLQQISQLTPPQLGTIFRKILQYSAFALATLSAHLHVFDVITLGESLQTSNPSMVFSSTYLIHGVLTLFSFLPSLLGAGLLLMGADWMPTLTQQPFGEPSLAQSHRLALRSRQMLVLSIALSITGNLLQLFFLSSLSQVSISFQFPLFSLLVCLAFALLCHCIAQGKALEEDNQSII